AQLYDMSVVNIIENTTAIQAVYHKALNMLQVVFYQAGTVNFQGKSVTVDRPCALMIKKGGDVTISNPSQTYSNVLVNIKTKGGIYSKVIELPTMNNTRGASATIN